MVNKVILVGNVGVDPEVRTLETGTKVARVRLATGERYRDKQTGETKEHTEWHTVTLWSGLADVVDRFVRKGSQLYIEGQLRSREWTEKEGGAKRYATEIVAQEMKLLGKRPESVPAPLDGTSYGSGGATSAPVSSRSEPLPPVSSQSERSESRVLTPSDDIDDLPF